MDWYGTGRDPLLPDPAGLEIVPPTEPNLLENRPRRVDDYLHILFTHFREDLVSALRTAIHDFRQKQANITKKQEPQQAFPGANGDYDAYSGAQKKKGKRRRTDRPDINGGHYYEVLRLDSHAQYPQEAFMTFSTHSYSNLCWNRTSLLKERSILAITSDFFQTWSYALITDRNYQVKGAQGNKPFRGDSITVSIRFLGANTVKRTGPIWAIEPSSYYEAYRPVLERIQLFQRWKKLPFQRYIVGNDTRIARPSYMKPGHRLCLLDGDLFVTPEEIARGGLPGASLDESQQRAIAHALTHELALVEGAPGTGKSHVGVQLVRVLHENRSMWQESPENSTIVIMAYTNHAVDHFILECEKIGLDTSGVVRLGFQYCEAMEKYSVNQKNKGRQSMLSILQQANIIAMTTTGASKYADLMEQVEPEIVIVEEAAQITEAHLVASLTHSCKHLILLGDHWQLRPNVSEQAAKYGLEVSLFERLLLANMPVVRLEYQFRMHPDIVKVLVPHIYPRLQSDRSVLRYPEVKGMQRRVVFFEHEHEDDMQDEFETKSKVSPFECKVLTSFCKYLLQQGYEPKSVVILSVYKEQVFAICDALEELDIPVSSATLNKRKDRNDRGDKRPKKNVVRVNTVDAFQGEQGDIILVSFVSSNKTAFLEIHRVSAALSCARHGFYAMGNFRAYLNSSRSRRQQLGKVHMIESRTSDGYQRTENERLWNELYVQWSNQGDILHFLPIQCQQHKDKRMKVTDQAQFEIYAPDGGCGRPCTVKYCHHGVPCTRNCHPNEEHRSQCPQPVVVVLRSGNEKGMQCKDLADFKWKGDEQVTVCFNACNHHLTVGKDEARKAKCQQILSIEPKFGGCAHKKQIYCFENTIEYLQKLAIRCEEKVEFKCPHCPGIMVACRKLRSTECENMVSLKLECSHEKNVVCRLRYDPDTLTCREIVRVSFNCGHIKTVQCYLRHSVESAGCDVVINPTLDCGHVKLNVICRQRQLPQSRKCLQNVNRTLACGHQIHYVCHDRERYNSESYQCRVNVKLHRDCGHDNSVLCYDMAAVKARPCRVQVTTGILFWKKYYECSEYQALKKKK